MKIFKLDVLRVKVAVSFLEDAKEARDTLGEWLKCNIVAAENGGSVEDQAGFVVAHLRRTAIWIGPECSRSQVFHECYHALQRTLHEINSDKSDEELNAHILEFITEKVLCSWEKHHGLKTIKTAEYSTEKK